MFIGTITRVRIEITKLEFKLDTVSGLYKNQATTAIKSDNHQSNNQKSYKVRQRSMEQSKVKKLGAAVTHLGSKEKT